MKSNVKALPIAHEALGEMVRGQDWGGMTSAYMGYTAGLDFGPLLEGLEGKVQLVRNRTGPHHRAVAVRWQSANAA